MPETTVDLSNRSRFIVDEVNRLLRASVSLTQLDLSVNRIGDEGAKALAAGVAASGQRLCTFIADVVPIEIQRCQRAAGSHSVSDGLGAIWADLVCH